MLLDLFSTTWQDVWRDVDLTQPVGAVFTKPEVVDLILDLAGYCPERGRLANHPLLEPSCGDGAFLQAILRRLIAGELNQTSQITWDDTVFNTAIRAVDINSSSIEATRQLVVSTLTKAGCPNRRATELASLWVIQTDFLLADLGRQFDFIIGNPPYVRIEDLPKRVLGQYRSSFSTLSDRADLYIAFFEKGLELLSPCGALAFICANRFTKNQYGEALRRLIAQRYHVRHYFNLEHTQPFVSEVSAYPAIVVIDRQKGKSTRSANLIDITPNTLQSIRAEALAKRSPKSPVSEFETWYPNGVPWLTTSNEEHALLANLNRSLPTLENSAPGTKVGIGVATGADSVFILPQKHPEIESSRQIPLMLPADVSNTNLAWSGKYLLNPFSDTDDGSLVELKAYPGFAAYIEAHMHRLKGRHCARTRPQTWYRTIDRVWPKLQHRSKLIIPDIQVRNTIGFDEGRYYPHHNLYWITSDSWPLDALKALLRSSIVYQQVRAHSVQMRGSTVRFQAQTLRRIRLPYLNKLSSTLLEQLGKVSNTENQETIDVFAEEAFAQCS